MSKVEQFNIQNEKEFQDLMESINEELIEKDIKVFQRPIHAWFTISKRYKLGLVQTPQKREPIEGVYSGADLTIRIFRWFDERYGNLVKMNPNWDIAILIRGDIYKMKIPLVFGAVKAICSAKAFGNTSTSNMGVVDEIPTLSILDTIEELSKEYVEKLDLSDLGSLMKDFQLGMKYRNLITPLSEKVLIRQAKGDIDAAVTNIFSNPPQYGLSKWSSLQATEKIFKAFLIEKGVNFKFSHDLKYLSEEAEKSGLNVMSASILDMIQCPAGVRYGNPSVNLHDAIKAHYASLEVCSAVLEDIHKIIKNK